MTEIFEIKKVGGAVMCKPRDEAMHELEQALAQADAAIRSSEKLVRQYENGQKGDYKANNIG